MDKWMEKESITTDRNSFLEKIRVFNELTLIIISFVTAMLIWSDQGRPIYYSWLPVLPLCHGLVFTVCIAISRRILENWCTAIAVFLYSIRNVITPFAMYMGSYYGSFQILPKESAEMGISLMIFETMVVFGYLAIKVRGKDAVKKRDSVVPLLHNGLYQMIAGGLLLFCVAAYIFIPGIRQAYTTIFSKHGLRSELLENSSIGIGTIRRGCFTLFQVVFPIVYMFAGTAWIVRVNHKGGIAKPVKIGLMMVGIVIPAFFMNGSDGHTFLSMGALFLTALFVGGRSMRPLVRLAAVGGGMLFLYIFMQAMTSTFVFSRISFWENISNMLQAYFPGVCNMAGVFNTGSYDRFAELFYDVYSTIPFRNTLFGLSGFTSLPNLYTIDNQALSHIMPCVGHAYYYLGVFAPVVPCFLYSRAWKAYRIMEQTANPYIYMANAILFLYLEATPVMYNMVIFGTHYLVQLLPMVLLARISLCRGRSMGNPVLERKGQG